MPTRLPSFSSDARVYHTIGTTRVILAHNWIDLCELTGSGAYFTSYPGDVTASVSAKAGAGRYHFGNIRIEGAKVIAKVRPDHSGSGPRVVEVQIGTTKITNNKVPIFLKRPYR
jgi:hypothetical protein